MQGITNQEARTLAAAADLLQQVRGRVRVLDIISSAVNAYTHDGPTCAAWDAFERQVNRLGVGQDPEFYCDACAGEGEKALPPDETGRVRMDVCMACMGHAYLGRPAPKLPPLYAPGDEALMPLF
jgi:hypothetical protein